MQPVGLSVAYLRLTIVLISPNANNGIPKTESPIKI
jgi:hypothetical protein